MVREGEGKLDADGRMEVEFEIPEPERGASDYTYRLEARLRTVRGVSSMAKRDVVGHAVRLWRLSDLSVMFTPWGM